MIVTLRNSPTNQPIDDNEVRRKFQQFGDVKAVRPAGEREECVATSFDHWNRVNLMLHLVNVMLSFMIRGYVQSIFTPIPQLISLVGM